MSAEYTPKGALQEEMGKMWSCPRQLLWGQEVIQAEREGAELLVCLPFSAWTHRNCTLKQYQRLCLADLWGVTPNTLLPKKPASASLSFSRRSADRLFTLAPHILLDGDG